MPLSSGCKVDSAYKMATKWLPKEFKRFHAKMPYQYFHYVFVLQVVFSLKLQVSLCLSVQQNESLMSEN